MYSNNKQIRGVAAIAAQIMSGQQPVEEELKGGQKKIDKNHNGKIDGQDFAILRGQKKANEEVEQIDELSINTLSRVKHAATSAASDASREGDEGKATKRYDLAGKASNKIETKNRAAGLKPSGQHTFEEVEQIDELSKDTLNSYVKKSFSDKEKDNLNTTQRQKGLRKATSRLYKEEEQIDEVKMADLPSTKVQGRAYGASKPEPHAVDVMKGPKDKDLKAIEAEKKKKKFSEMIDLYNEKGLKSLSEMLVKEEPDNEQFTKELEDAKEKSEGKKPNKEIAKGAVQAVKSEEVQTEEEVIEEREMTSAEMEKREKIVKSMKKGMAGFKERYGDRAKNVMYATATKQAMKD